MNISKGLKLVLKKKDLTQKELAQKVGISEKSISLLLNNKTNSRLYTVEAICKSLEIRPEILYLLSIEEEDVPKKNRNVFNMIWPTYDEFFLKLLIQ